MMSNDVRWCPWVVMLMAAALLHGCGGERVDAGPEVGAEFALSAAPVFPVSAKNAQRIDVVIAELARNYGGTLVVDPYDQGVDSSAFVARFLRTFSVSTDAHSYHYRCERLLDRLGSFPGPLSDSRLDWDVWRSFLIFEAAAAEREKRETEGTYLYANTSERETAGDLLGTYLYANATAILADRQRLAWWIAHLTAGMEVLGGHPRRPWFLLMLAASTDTRTPAPPENQGDTMQPDAFSPFLVIERGADGPPTFAEGLSAMARSQRLGFTAWGIDLLAMPPTQVQDVSLGRRSTSIYPARIVDQESWSKTPHFFRFFPYYPVGSRSLRYRVYTPAGASSDGVFLFTYDARLFVWPKARMNDGVVQMLLTSGVIDQTQFDRLLAAGFKPLPETLRGD